MTDEQTTGARGSGSFSDAEKEAMRERAKEARAAKKGSKQDGEAAVRAKIDEMTGTDKEMAERVHTLVMEHAPELQPRTWYGMPAYYRDGKVLCFFQSAAKFKARYATFGFDESARLDDGNMWATSFALTRLTATEEKRIVELIRRAMG